MKLLCLQDKHIGKINGSIGNKNKNLSVLSACGIKTPRGCAITSDVFTDFSKSIKSNIQHILTTEPAEIASMKIRKLFFDLEIKNDFKKEIEHYLNSFSNNTRFAVRSSGICIIDEKQINEDSMENSLAGQFDSYLMVPSKKVIDAIKLCWASLYNMRSISSFYLKNDLSYLNSSMSVTIQEMIVADISAVVMTRDPVEKREVMGIEATWGPCEALVSGNITGDFFIINRKDGIILEKECGPKEKIAVYTDFSEKNPNNCNYIKTSERQRKTYTLNKDKLNKLINLCFEIEKIFEYPQDIELVFQNDDIFIIQSRNITNIKEKEVKFEKSNNYNGLYK